MSGKLLKTIVAAVLLALALSVSAPAPTMPTGVMADVCGTTAS
jgi:hypothetical protein